MFTPDFFQFLRDLSSNNQREWFQSNKQRYDNVVRQPLLNFIEAIADPLEDISPHFVADKSSMFRIHRDTRFSANKLPYKTHAAAQFRHEQGKDAHAPCFYLHLENLGPEPDAGGVFVGGGLWMPDASTLTSVRNAIVAWPERWKRVSEAVAVEGESLKRPPRGYDAAHVHIDDIKRKSFVSSVRFSPELACAPDFDKQFLEACRHLSPMVAFLCQALDLPF